MPAVPASADRRVHRRPPLPSRRALIGGLLVALAVLGSWWAGGPASAPAGRRYVVAAHRLAPGAVLGSDDLTTARADLPDRVADGLATSGEQVAGRRLLAPLGPGDPLPMAVVGPPATGGPYQLSFPVDPAWAVDGTLVAGERVDVLVTTGQGADATTRRVLRSVAITALRRDDGGGLGGEATQVLTVAVRTADRSRALVSAARAGDITLVRTPGGGS